MILIGLAEIPASPVLKRLQMMVLLFPTMLDYKYSIISWRYPGDHCLWRVWNYIE